MPDKQTNKLIDTNKLIQ